MNLKQWAQQLEIEEDELLEIVDLFIKTSFSDLAKLQAAIEERDILPVVKAAHSIKGAAGILGLLEIHEAAKRIETAARKNHPESINENVRAIRTKLDLITEALK
ncbi:MAG: Hpt domain-containing protein [Deltaproteobacteria bacterium]|nr:Hpt domain-containing protein [Deltaproteobacteria bacterium]